jgi:hypothetical protein
MEQVRIDIKRLLQTGCDGEKLRRTFEINMFRQPFQLALNGLRPFIVSSASQSGAATSSSFPISSSSPSSAPCSSPLPISTADASLEPTCASATPSAAATVPVASASLASVPETMQPAHGQSSAESILQHPTLIIATIHRCLNDESVDLHKSLYRVIREEIRRDLMPHLPTASLQSIKEGKKPSRQPNYSTVTTEPVTSLWP